MGEYATVGEEVREKCDAALALLCDAAELLAPVYAVPLGGVRCIVGEMKAQAGLLAPGPAEAAPTPESEG